MAGFINRGNGIISNMTNSIRGPIRKLRRLGQDYDDLIISQRLGIGQNEAQLALGGGGDESAFFIARQADISNNNKSVGFYQKDYVSQRDFLRSMASHREISKLIDIVADETIVYDHQNYFAVPNTKLLDDLSEEKEEEIKNSIVDNFDYIYSMVYNFTESNTAWRLFRQYLIDGILAYELVYNKKGDKIIKAIPLDASSVVPDVQMIDGSMTKVWVQYPNDTRLTRVIPDTHIVYISYGKSTVASEISYAQSLIRSFNLFRTIENTAVIWNLMHSTFRLKMVVPVSGSRMRNEQAVGELTNRYREEIIVDSQSGEVKIDGNPSLNLFRNYAIASKGGQQTEIDSLKFDGYDMSSPDLLKYWRDKLWEDSQIPFSRLQKDSSPTFVSGLDQMERDEIRFSRFINRIRSDFQEILIKPLLIQMQLDYPELQNDSYFASKIGVRFNKDNLFETMKMRDEMAKKVEFINMMSGLQGSDDKPFFDVEVLIEEFGDFGHDLLKKNRERKEALEKEGSEEGDMDMDDGFGDGGEFGGGGMDMGGPPSDASDSLEAPDNMGSDTAPSDEGIPTE